MGRAERWKSRPDLGMVISTTYRRALRNGYIIALQYRHPQETIPIADQVCSSDLHKGEDKTHDETLHGSLHDSD